MQAVNPQVSIDFSAPFKLKKNPWWGLRIDLESAEQLAEIPGLSVNTFESRAEGLIDAVAAACRILNRPLPPTRQPHENVIDNLPPLHPYQLQGVGLLHAITKEVGSAILADDMGLGKTRQAIAFTKSRDGRVLVVCPAFVRESWRAELQRLGEDSVSVLGPILRKSDEAEWENARHSRWVVTSYDHRMMEKAWGAAFAASSPAFFIMDEAHRLRGRDAKRTKLAKEIAALSNIRLMLTGTPMWSRPRDFYALLAILFGTRFGNQYNFDRRYCNGGVNEHGGWDNKGATNAEELKCRLAYYMVRRERHEVAAQLPSLTRQVIWCDPSKEAEIAFHRALLTKDPGSTHAALLATHKAKVEAALHLAHEAKRFLLLTYRKSLAHQMAEELNADGTPCLCITGEMSTPDRQAAVRQAQASKCGIVATIDSIYEGVDGIQHVADVGIMHALDYVPLKMAQAEARLHRLGQVSPVSWFYLACKDSMDSLVVNTIVNKMDQNRAIMGQHVNRELRDSLADSAGMSDTGAAEALRALYESL